MPTIDTYRKQAKLLCRWHRDRNHSIGEKLRLLERFRSLTDREALDRPMPLMLAQEIVAVEAGFPDWAALRRHADPSARDAAPAAATAPRLAPAVPILFVRDVAEAADFYRERIGFDIDFLHGSPPFYGSVSRDRACLHLRHVGAPNFADLAAREVSLILATIEVSDVKAVFAELSDRGAPIAQKLRTQPWGGTDFHVRDPDGNVISFVQFRTPTAPRDAAGA
jgi:uncharacterized glyoxalase superfamily protein PhnB